MVSPTETTIFQRDGATIGIMPIVSDPESILAQLERKEWYTPAQSQTGNRRSEWLSVRLLLKKMLHGEEKKINYTPAGKPYFADQSYQISISHTKGFVAAVIHPRKKVAIDIEYTSPRIEKIQDRFLSEEEKKHLSPTLRLEHLILHWSVKESLFKLLDEENIEFKSQLHLFPFEPKMNEWDTISAQEKRTPKKEKLSIRYFAGEHFILTFIVSA